MSDKLELSGSSQADVEAAVRRYIAKVARRYSPLLIGLLVLLLVVILVPSVSPQKATNVATGSGGSVGSSGIAGGDTGTTVAGAAGGPVGGPAGSAGGAQQRAAAVPKGITAPAAAGSAGVTRSGVQCGPGVRQVPWSVYAPLCVPTYSGNNGGNTSPSTQGVTADTVTVTFRRTNSTEEKAAFSIAGSAAPGSDDQYLSDLRAYVDLFNRTYELYGRRVVVKDYQPQGDNLEEDQGRQLAGAQADAAKAKDLGAFADISQSPSLAATIPYEEALANERVIGIGAIGVSFGWFQSHAPWEYSFIANNTKAATVGGLALCQRAAGLPAIFAGDAIYKNQTRKFGLVAPNGPEYQKAADVFQQTMQKTCGVTMAKRASYAIDVSQFAQEGASLAAQMKAAGVTTVICACDPLIEITFSQAADGQAYHPEWFVTSFYDPQARETSQNEWNHALTAPPILFPPRGQRESYKVFKMARPNAEPAEKYFDLAYQNAVYLFSALQNAGPNLNPATFQEGVFSMPKSGLGEWGTWNGGPQAYDPQSDAVLAYWDPNRPADFDGVKGAWVPCEGGKYFPFDDPSAFGTPHTQAHCFGQ
ncbi:MAG: hypothetical protein JOZ68_12815 [Acidimicrobiia bacterium]|nr:hypothetical protein [Acidimicrobiia bacterium]MBV9041882.1 hypothetical protein [Acidimicrobiia bacterium]